VIVDVESAILGDPGLAPLDLRVKELFDASALQAHEVIVMRAFIQLEDRLAAFKVVAHQQACLFELGEHAIDRGKSDVGVFAEKHLIDVLGGEVPLRAVLKQVEDLEPRESGLKPDVSEIIGF